MAPRLGQAALFRIHVVKLTIPLTDIQTKEPANPAPIDKDVIKERLYALLETLKQDPIRVNAFFREHLSPISCTPIQKKERRYYQARGATNMENLMNSLGLGRNFAIGGCGGSILSLFYSAHPNSPTSRRG